MNAHHNAQLERHVVVICEMKNDGCQSLCIHTIKRQVSCWFARKLRNLDAESKLVI